MATETLSITISFAQVFDWHGDLLRAAPVQKWQRHIEHEGQTGKGEEVNESEIARAAGTWRGWRAAELSIF